MRKAVCVDLDGVLAQYDGWKGHEHIGDPIPGAQQFVEAILEFADVVIHTSRLADDAGRADWTETRQEDSAKIVWKWICEHDFTGCVRLWTDPGKPLACAYVDDRAVVCRPMRDDQYDFDRALREVRALVSGEPLGGVGTASHGQLDETDEGDLRLMVSSDDGNVRIDFGKHVAWLGFPKDQAVDFAMLILKHAGVKICQR
jgi:hypothetical protein